MIGSLCGLGLAAREEFGTAPEAEAMVVKAVARIKTADLVQEVTAASMEQSPGIGQLNKAMMQVDQVTQRNASAAEELSSTAAEMASRGAALEDRVFRLPPEARSGLPTLPARPPLPASVPSPPPPASGQANGQGLLRQRFEKGFVRF